MLTEVAKRDLVWKLVLDQLTRGRRKQRLAAMRGGADPGRARDIQPYVPGRCNIRLAGVKANPN